MFDDIMQVQHVKVEGDSGLFGMEGEGICASHDGDVLADIKASFQAWVYMLERDDPARVGNVAVISHGVKAGAWPPDCMSSIHVLS